VDGDETLTLRRFDVVGSTIRDSSPRFSIPAHLVDGPAQRGELSPSLQALILRLNETSIELGEVGQALERAAYVASFVNKNAHQPQFWKHGANATKLIGPVTHFLLSMPRLPDFTQDSNIYSEPLLREMVRLALLILLAGLKMAFSLISDELGPLQERFSILLLPAPSTYSLFPELSLWAIIVVASLYQGPSREWQIAEIRRAMRDMNIPTGEAAIEVAKNIIWIEALTVSEVERLSPEIDHDSNLHEAEHGRP
jgi:hypothetical protein